MRAYLTIGRGDLTLSELLLEDGFAELDLFHLHLGRVWRQRRMQQQRAVDDVAVCTGGGPRQRNLELAQ